MTTNMKVQMLAYSDHAAPPDGEDRFVERRRIALLEPDAALRPVLIVNLLRLGCVVSARRELPQVIEALQCGPLDGAIVALEGNRCALDALNAANRGGVPLVVLTDTLPEPHMVQKFPGMHFLQKPFDTRELLNALHLPQKAAIIRGG